MKKDTIFCSQRKIVCMSLQTIIKRLFWAGKHFKVCNFSKLIEKNHQTIKNIPCMLFAKYQTCNVIRFCEILKKNQMKCFNVLISKKIKSLDCHEEACDS